MKKTITSVDKTCSTCEYRAPLFEALNEKELDFINMNRLEVIFKTGEIIRKQGAFLTHVISIQTGLAKMYLEGYTHNDVILKIIKPQNFIGGPGMYVDHRHHYTVKALQETCACFLEVKAFKSLLNSNADFADEFFKDFSKNSLSTYDRLINLTQKQISGRMADGLIYLSKQIFESEEFELPLSTKDLGGLTSMSPDSATKLIRLFREEGIIAREGKKIIIKDMNALENISAKA